MFEDIAQIFENNGISSESIKTGLIVFSLIHLAWVLTLWVLCYFFNPTKTVLSKIPIKYIKDKMNQASTNVNNGRLYNLVPKRLRGKVFFALCESWVIKAVTAPLILPIKIWLTIIIVAE